MIRISTISAAALAAAVCISPAVAAPKAKTGKPPAWIEIANQRQAALESFDLVEAGESGKIVARLGKPLAGGKGGKLTLKGAKGCDYIARWKFDDAGDEAEVNLCNDPKIVLTD